MSDDVTTWTLLEKVFMCSCVHVRACVFELVKSISVTVVAAHAKSFSGLYTVAVPPKYAKEIEDKKMVRAEQRGV